MMAEKREETLREELSAIHYATNQGIELGMAKGIAKGRIEGRAEGRAEATEEIMEKLRKLGIDEETLKKAVEK